MNIVVTCFLSVVLLFLVLISTDTPKLKRNDLQILTGEQWTGTLTYLDYSTNKKVSIPSNLMVTESKVDKFAWLFDYQYRDEPNANGTKDVILSKDGRTFNGEDVVAEGKN